MQLTTYSPVKHRALFPYDKETVTVSNVAIDLDSDKTNACVEAYVQIEGGDVRARWDGTDPALADGPLFLEGSVLHLTRTEAKRIRFIRNGSVDVTAWVIYYR